MSPAPVALEANHTIEELVNATLKLKSMMEKCSEETDGFCYESYPKGVIFYNSFRHCSETAINLPGINLLPNWLIGVMWSLMLLWLFFGVAVISDAFVEAIEVITSTEHIVAREDEEGNVVYQKEPVWNWVVANISLLAVGSSSPEILLAIVEACTTLGHPAGEIGPACIIGSGAYNLFAITAVLTAVLPTGTFKRIEHQKVFAWTTTWSIWAHIWVWLIYKKISPDVIDLWEGLVTLGFFPILVYTAWLVDTRGWRWFGRNKNQVVPSIRGDEKSNLVTKAPHDEEMALQSVGTSTGKLNSPPPLGVEKSVASQAGSQFQKLQPGANEVKAKKSVLYYRHMAVQNVLGGKAKPVEVKDTSIETAINMEEVEAMHKSNPKVLFKCAEVSVLESAGKAKIEVIRMHGDPNATIHVRYETVDDTALAGLDFDAAEGILTFGPGETTKEIIINVVDDDMSEPDVVFSVVLLSAEVDETGKGPSVTAVNKKSLEASGRTGSGKLSAAKPTGSNTDVLIVRKKCHVTIVDDDDGGILAFELPTVEAGAADPYAEVIVRRRNGADGNVSIDYATKDGTATSGHHFKETKGVLSFASGETVQAITIPILPFDSTTLVPGQLAFKLTISNPLGGVMLGQRKECRVVVVPGNKLSGKTLAERVKEENGEEEFNLWHAWRTRFKDAILPASPDDDDGMWIALFLHYISITFKVIAAFVPPAEYLSGYLSLPVALLLLGGLMFIVKNVARMLGCIMGLSDLMTGLSIVAVGTSLPDTFGTLYATLHSDTADEGIGNVMGSNCVNIFLGLGIPYVISTSYYMAKKTSYVVSAGALGFSVMVYNVLTLAAIAMLLYMRTKGGELGSPNATWKIGLILFYAGLWIIFLILAGLLDYHHFADPGF